MMNDLLKERGILVELNDYLKLSYRMENAEDKGEGGYVASFPDLK